MKWLLAAALFFALAADAQAAPPVCSNVAVSTSHAMAKLINPVCTGRDVGSTLTFTPPSHGAVRVVGDAYEYTPVTGYAGTDSFTYTVANGADVSIAKTITITVTVPVPICAGTSGSFGAGRGKTVNLLCGSQVAQEFAIVAAPAHGTLNTFDSASGTVIYIQVEEPARRVERRDRDAVGDRAPGGQLGGERVVRAGRGQPAL
jgi:hypothetical protein